MTEWDVTARPHCDAVVRDCESYLRTHIQLRRRPGFYLRSIMSLVFVISVMNWCMYIVTPETLNDRLGISITLFLAQVAFNFAVADVGIRE